MKKKEIPKGWGQAPPLRVGAIFMVARLYKKEIPVMLNKNLLIIFLLCLAVWGCERRDDVVAHVGRRKITVRDFKKRMNELPNYYLGFVQTEGGRRQYLSGMIREEILLKIALDNNLDKHSDIAERLADAERGILLVAAMEYLQKEKVRISDQETRDYYEINIEKFSNPISVKVSHILLSDEETAKKLMSDLARGASFERLARENSIDTFTAINSGDMGYLEQGTMPEEFEKAVFSLQKVGQISDIIKTPFGYHIAKLTGRRRGRKQTYEEAADEIKRRLEKEKFNAMMDNFRHQYNVRVDYEMLDGINLIEEEKIEQE